MPRESDAVGGVVDRGVSQRVVDAVQMQYKYIKGGDKPLLECLTDLFSYANALGEEDTVADLASVQRVGHAGAGSA